jgi:hypothetical protein
MALLDPVVIGIAAEEQTPPLTEKVIVPPVSAAELLVFCTVALNCTLAFPKLALAGLTVTLVPALLRVRLVLQPHLYRQCGRLRPPGGGLLW